MSKINNKPTVGIIMGSQSDWEVMKETKDQLDELSITNEQLIISAHRTPNRILDYAKKSLENGIKVIIAGAGGAAHLPGMMASHTQIPVIGVPIESTSLNGIDSLLSIVQMPKGIPVATVSIGKTGAKNAAILAAEILSLQDEKISTPNLDLMAASGQTWTNFYASSSVCTPSRAGLLTGILPVRNGLYGDQIAVFFPGSKTGIPKNQLTLAEVFQSNGYSTGIFGKWHLGDAAEFLPTRHGFDEYIGIPYSNDMDWNVNGITFDKLISRPDLYEEYAKISSVITEQIFNPSIKDWNVPLLRSIKRLDGYTDEVLETPADQK